MVFIPGVFRIPGVFLSGSRELKKILQEFQISLKIYQNLILNLIFLRGIIFFINGICLLQINNLLGIRENKKKKNRFVIVTNKCIINNICKITYKSNIFWTFILFDKTLATGTYNDFNTNCNNSFGWLLLINIFVCI